MKGKITAIMLSSAIVLTGGISIAYYNTKSLGFDDNVKIFSSDNEKISFLDFNFYYQDIDDFFKNVKEYLPENQPNTGPKITYNIGFL